MFEFFVRIISWKRTPFFSAWEVHFSGGGRGGGGGVGGGGFKKKGGGGGGGLHGVVVQKNHGVEGELLMQNLQGK